MKKYIISLVLAFSLLFVLWRNTSKQFVPAPLKGIRLVLFVVVDQFAAEYRERFIPYTKGGLHSLFQKGVVFTNAQQDHAITATCQGHAALYTGAYPRTNGIVGNEWFDTESGTNVKCVEDETYEFSPQKILVTGLGEWLRDRYGSSVKVYSVSGKARGAITLGGRGLNAAYWFDGGQFRSSSYFKDSPQEGDWIENFHSSGKIERYFGSSWSPAPYVKSHFTELGAHNFSFGDFPDTFPHPLGRISLAPDDHYYEAIEHSPYLDSLTTDFALELIKNEGLGSDDVPDFLGVSYSALDRVGHHYGPHSEELIDTFFNLDKELARLLDSVDKRVGLEHALIVLSSDHGVQSFPEYVNHDGGHLAHRVDVDDILCVQKKYGKLVRRFGEGIFISDGYINREALHERKFELHELLESIRNELESCSFVKKVWTIPEIKNCVHADETCLRYQRTYFPGRSPDFYLQPEENYSHWYGSGTGHGTPYGYDSSIPLVFMHPSISPQLLQIDASAVDVAPTVAYLLGARGAPTVDGDVLELDLR